MISIEQRLSAVEELLKAVVNIAASPAIRQFPQITRLMNFLGDVGISVAVSPEQQYGVNLGKKFKTLKRFSPSKTANPEKSLAIYPLFSEDAAEHLECKYYLERVKYLSYGPKSNMILMNMQAPETILMKAYCFLHELGHAFSAYAQGRALLHMADFRSADDRIAEEVDIWTLEYKLLMATGGPKYCESANEMARFALLWAQGLMGNICTEGCGAALEYCWGPCPCKEAKIARDASFAGYCTLLAADKYFPEPQANILKFDFIRKAYGNY